MKKSIFSTIALLMALCMLLGVFASCTSGNGGTESSSSDPTSAQTEEKTSEKETENTETSEIDSVENKTEDTETTETQTEDTQTTETQTVETSGTVTSETETSETETSGAETSETETSETKTSETETSGAETSETVAPETSETIAPETSETIAPETSETTAPETTETEETESGLQGEQADLIELNNSMANGVQAYFTDGSRNYFNFTNKNMTMSYARSSALDQQVAYIANTKGNAYIQNTMDVFIRMTDGSIHYASNSTKSAEANLYRFGYYYYEGLFEFQNFVPKNFEIDIKDSPKVAKLKTSDNMVERKNTKNGPMFTITDESDPYFVFKELNYSSAEVNTVSFTAIASSGISNCTIFIGTDTLPLAQNTSLNIPIYGDGEAHTYNIDLTSIPGYSGNLTQFRIDPAGIVGDSITITSLEFGYADLSNVPANVSINRHFHVYTDKMHQAIQFATTKETSDIAEVGMITKIPTDTVAKVIVIDDDGEHNSFDGIDWAKVYAVGFDIKDAGIFGYILPVHETAGTISVTEDDGNYVILQTRVPTDNKLIPSISGEYDKNGNHTHATGVTNNGNDFYVSQRIYTDENHDFDTFIIETFLERNPIPANQIKIGEGSDNASFRGYDPVRGIYVFNIVTPVGGFNSAYNNPQKNYKVNFTLAMGKQVSRNAYFMTSGTSGILECAAILDADNMMLPIPIEVIKNFSEATGERNLFNIGDPTFSEAIFMLSLETGKKYEYNVLNLYQNWGNYPLKQLSCIPFHCPYYHLSTGTTETNCIVPWFGTSGFGKPSSTLPDFRSMSAPFWQTQPQHNSCGAHTWLKYTDSEGGTYLTESTKQIITSYGPTYAELVWENISDDGKIKITYTHMEMPQLDENRSYYTMEYEFLEDLTINSFKDNFQFYNVTDNNLTGTYKKLGYLNKSNECVVIDSNQDKDTTPEYVLGDNCPYFSFFMMPDWNRESDSAEGYSNVAFLIYNSDFVIGGEEKDYNFLIKNPKDHVTLTLNEEGTVEFKAGDKITINAILLPWGSQQYEDDPANRLNKQNATEYTDITYSTVLEDGTLYMDKNVRDVRENTLLNPLTVTSETDEIIESAFLPKVKSADGKTATFTLSGGANNVTVRVYGFDMLTAPKVEELVGGNWVEYKLNSADNPVNGFYHYYDGYSVQYDGDGTYSYSFVTTMTDGAPRTFRIFADKEFEGWPKEILPEENEDFLKAYIDSEELYEASAGYKSWFGTITNNQTHVTFTGNGNEEMKEAYFLAYQGQVETGEYFVIKYRVPSTSASTSDIIEIYTSTANASPVSGDCFKFSPIRDGEWHIMVVNIANSSCETYVKDSDGKYHAKYLRVDVFNRVTATDVELDIAFVGIDSSLEEICKHVQEDFPLIDYIDGGTTSVIDTYTYEPYVKTYIDPSSDYTQSDAIFGSIVDTINGTSVVLNNYSIKKGVATFNTVSASKDMKVVLSGWACVEGGIEKYVWSADGGKTWNDFPNQNKLGNADNNMTSNVETANKVPFSDAELAKKNGTFKESTTPLIIDLSAYVGQTVDVTVAAVSALDDKSLVLLYHLEKISCKYDSVFVDGSAYSEANVLFGAHADSINDTANVKTASNLEGYGTYENIVTDEELKIVVKGWSVAEGGIVKYVWTADGGLTWNDCGGSAGTANDAIIASGQSKSGTTFADAEKARTNGAYQGTGLIIDLSAYADTTEPISFYLCAVTESNHEKVVVLYYFDGVTLSTAK